MAWRVNKKIIAAGFADLKYLPRTRGGRDATLACLAYGARLGQPPDQPDLNAWAARHGTTPSRRYEDLGDSALVLWHGTSRERAEKIRRHGLFHRRGLWTARDPRIPHAFCRGRSERFGVEGAVLCLVLDRNSLVEGDDYTVDRQGNVHRFHHGLDPEVVEYVLVHDAIEFTGEARARHCQPWHVGRFKKRQGRWVPMQHAPVRYGAATSYSSLSEFLALCVDRLLAEFGEVTTLEIFSTVYGCVQPWEALEHQAVFDVIELRCTPRPRPTRQPVFRAAAPVAV